MLPVMALPIHDPGPWVKFWWKGVDIVSDVVKSLLTAGIVAIVAYLTWEKKKRREQALDLEHDRNKKMQEEQLARRFASERTQRERTAAREEKIRLWKAGLADLLNRFPKKQAPGTKTLYHRYSEWLETNGLIAFGNNLEVVRQWHFSDFDRIGEGINIIDDIESIEKFRSQIANTDLPKPDDDAFAW
jgi:hypothetical protein